MENNKEKKSLSGQRFIKPETVSFSKKLLKSVESAKLRFDKHISSQKLEGSLDGKKNDGKLL